jgi:hypothetical protein
MSENETTQNENASQPVDTSKVLNPVTRKIVERCIQEVLSEYVQQTKQFTADSIHYLRVKVTDLVKQRLGDDEVVSVDLGLDLSNIEDIPFFFKINIPQDKLENHLMNTETTTDTAPK